MIEEIKKDSQTIYVCEICGLAYEEKECAEKCQQWCERYNSCNLEITQHAVFLTPED